MDWYNDNWLYCKKITIDHTKVIADLTDQTILVDLANLGSAFFSHVKSDGGDIRVTKSDGTTELPIDVVAISTGGSTGELHFKLTGTLSSATDTEIYIYYGNSGASKYSDSATFGAENAWASHYKAVYHMNDLTSTTIKDSTVNRRNGTKASQDNPNTDTGKIGQAQYFSGSSGDYILLPNDCFDALNTGSIQAWVKAYATDGGYHIWGSQATNGLYFGHLSDNRAYVQSYPLPNQAYKMSNFMGSGFSHLCWKSSGSAWSAYLNGGTAETLVQIAGANEGVWYADIASGTTLNYLGRSPYGGYYFKGWIDEWRISSDQFSEAKNKTDYNNQNSPSTFYSVGDEIPKPSVGMQPLFCLIIE